MRYRVRTWVGAQPLPNLDVTTNSYPVAIEACRARAVRFGWDDVSLNIAGERPFKGGELKQLVERYDAQR